VPPALTAAPVSVPSPVPRSDFANGFLVAEILSRYYKSDISLHSFDNGLGLVKRIENWALIDKFLRKIGSPIDRNIIDQVIHCKKDAAIPLMEQLYTLLTHKTSARSNSNDPSDLDCMQQSQSLLALDALCLNHPPLRALLPLPPFPPRAASRRRGPFATWRLCPPSPVRPRRSSSKSG